MYQRGHFACSIDKINGIYFSLVIVNELPIYIHIQRNLYIKKNIIWQWRMVPNIKGPLHTVFVCYPFRALNAKYVWVNTEWMLPLYFTEQCINIVAAECAFDGVFDCILSICVNMLFFFSIYPIDPQDCIDKQ